MVGEEHLEEAAQALKKYIDVNTCGFCKRKAEGINRAIIGLREVTGEAQQLAAKIQERKELAGIDGGLKQPQPKPMPSYEPRPPTIPTNNPLPPYISPQQAPKQHPILSEDMKKRIAAKRTPQVATRSESSIHIEEESSQSIRDMLRNRPKIKDIFYLGD